MNTSSGNKRIVIEPTDKKKSYGEMIYVYR